MGPEHNRGCIFNIQQFSVHDGPGIRTLVFLKGCPLRCRWCSNPESQQFQSELAVNFTKCIGISECGRCIAACPQGALYSGASGLPELKREVCQQCLGCAAACPAGALSTVGQSMSVAEVLEAVEADSVFYARSGGGLTVSGGEPLAQPEFTLSLLRAARQRRIDTAMETSGYAGWPVLEQAAASLNTVIYDLKCLDDAVHFQGTGVSNALILSNFKKLAAAFPRLPILVRTPVIPGFNDSAEAITAIIDFIRDAGNIRYELLPYHRLGQPKYLSLARAYPLGEARLDEHKLQELKQLVELRYVQCWEN